MAVVRGKDLWSDSVGERLRGARTLSKPELAAVHAALCEGCPVKPWPYGNATSINPLLVTLGPSPGNSPNRAVPDPAGRPLDLPTAGFEHDGAGLAAMADWILSRIASSAKDVGVAIEVPHGPVVEAMMERGFAVHSLNPKQLDRFRDRFSPAGAKDDSREARTLADALPTDRHFFRRLEPETAEVIQLREWTRIANELTGERTRFVNRPRQQLWRYYPPFRKVASDSTKTWVPELWKLAPTPGKASPLRRATVETFLKSRRVRAIGAPDVLMRLREPAITVAPGTAEASCAMLASQSEFDPDRSSSVHAA